MTEGYRYEDKQKSKVSGRGRQRTTEKSGDRHGDERVGVSVQRQVERDK